VTKKPEKIYIAHPWLAPVAVLFLWAILAVSDRPDTNTPSPADVSRETLTTETLLMEDMTAARSWQRQCLDHGLLVHVRKGPQGWEMTCEHWRNNDDPEEN
jgi:hypothetical protein